MLNFNGIDHINMNVSNLENSIRFYDEVFGLKIKEEGISAKSGRPYAIIGKSNKGMLALYEVENFRQHGSINHLGFNVESIEGALAYFKSKNIPLNWGGLVEYPDSESIYIEDPDGYEIEVSNNFAGGL